MLLRREPSKSFWHLKKTQSLSVKICLSWNQAKSAKVRCCAFFTIVYLTFPIGSPSPPKEEAKKESPQQEKPKEPEPKKSEKPASPPPSESKPPPKKEAPKPAAPKPSPPTAGSRNETRVSDFCHSYKTTRSHAISGQDEPNASSYR